MARRILVLGLAVLLIVSTLMVLGTGGSRAQVAPLAPPSAAPHPAAPHPSVNSIQVETYEGNDVYYNDTYFASGGYNYPGENILFFWVYDPTADSRLNFTLSDPNASRDGVGSPAFTVNVPLNTTTHEYFSYLAGVSYTFPSSLAIGGTWVVNASAPLGGSAQYNITVATFGSDMSGSPRPYTGVLPGESITAAWQLYNLVNGAYATHVTNLALDGWYYSNGSYHNLFPGGIVNVSVSAAGDYTFTVPANASVTTYLYFDLWPTIISNGKLAENESDEIWWGVGSVDLQVEQETEYNGVCPTGYDSSYYSGSLVQVCATVGALWNDELYGVPNLPVSIHFWNGLSVVTPGGSPPTTLMSNSTGKVSFSYLATSPPLTSEYVYPYENYLNLSVTDPVATSPTSDWSKWSNTSLYVDVNGATGGVAVQLNQLEYYPGQTVTATWSLSSTNTAQTGTLTAVGWYAYNEQTDAFLAQGMISSTASTGTFNVALPTGFVGPFVVEVYAVNATTSFYGEAYGYSTTPRLFLNPSSTTFTPGSTVTITAEAYGDAALTGATITYQVWASFDLGRNYGNYGIVETGTVANNTAFTIAVPSSAAPGYYEVYGYLGSTASGIVASDELEIDQVWGYYVTLGVNTASSYSDGSYQPGQTLTVAFQITPYGNAPLPVLYTFYVDLNGAQIYDQLSSASTSGTFQITIPSGQPSGIAFLELELDGTYLSGNSCGSGYCYGETAITINAHPSVLSMEVGGNSGITVGWLILLIVILVVAVVLALLIRRKKTPPSSGGASTTTPMSPPAPAPSGTGAQEWSEPAPNQPPMPTPPPGST
ncbi:MAG TPA: hypothetical protein VK424_04680 [Thermoplasmata archaeon]|nr:hypothetical protein [Thermoplasmata archaeon]